MAGRSLRGPAAPLLLVVGVILGLAGLRSLGLVTLLPAGGPTGDGPGEVLASRPIDLERAGAAPGQRGSAVILGHVDTRKDGPAVFYQLERLRPGDTIRVRRRDGRTAAFQVDSVERFPRERFPTSRVYGPLDYPGLRLVTCGGLFDYQRHQYQDNVMVFASGRG